MNRLAFATAFLLLLLASGAQAQSPSRLKGITAATGNGRNAIKQLARLEQNVITYRSLEEFEESGRLARVSLATFESELRQVTSEVEVILERMPAGRLKTQLTNALASYRDGAFWWRQIDQSRVVDISALRYSERVVTPQDQALSSSIPYTVAINWRQAARYLAQAQRLVED